MKLSIKAKHLSNSWAWTLSENCSLRLQKNGHRYAYSQARRHAWASTFCCSWSQGEKRTFDFDLEEY